MSVGVPWGPIRRIFLKGAVSNPVLGGSTAVAKMLIYTALPFPIRDWRMRAGGIRVAIGIAIAIGVRVAIGARVAMSIEVPRDVRIGIAVVVGFPEVGITVGVAIAVGIGVVMVTGFPGLRLGILFSTFFLLAERIIPLIDGDALLE